MDSQEENRIEIGLKQIDEDEVMSNEEARAKMIQLLRVDIHQSMAEIEEARAGKRTLQTLQSLLDEDEE